MPPGIVSIFSRHCARPDQHAQRFVAGFFSLVPPPRILLIDNDAGVVEAMSCLLEDCGMVVFTASDGALGVAVAMRERPDSVLVDLQMPGLDAIEVAHSLAWLRQAQGARMVLLTARDRFGAAGAMSTGLFDACLLKPFSAAQLFASLAPPPPKPVTIN